MNKTREELVQDVEYARVAWATWGAIEEAGVFDAAAWDGVDESFEVYIPNAKIIL